MPTNTDADISAPFPEPDPHNPSDGINDTENLDLANFLAKVGTGTDGIAAPTAEDLHWPPIDRKYTEVKGEYYRPPDIIIGDSGKGTLRTDDANEDKPARPYESLLLDVMYAEGIYMKRGGITQFTRGACAAMLCCTGLGALWVAKRATRIEPGGFAMFYTLNNNPRYVPSGWSMETNPTHGKFKTYSINDHYVNFENHVHIVRVNPGKYVRARMNGNAVLLTSADRNRVGVHVIVDTTFEYDREVNIHESVIELSPLTVITVKAGHVRPVYINRNPHILFAGHHVFECATMDVHDNEYQLKKSVSFGMIQYYVVKPGELGGIIVNDQACFIDRPCELWFYSALVEKMECTRIEDAKVDFGPLTRLIVDDYLMGLIRDESGQLVVLRPGVHVIKRPNIHLATITGEWTHISVPMAAITADPLDVTLRMTMTYHVVDPIAFFKAGKPVAVHSAVKQMAMSIMSEIIRHMRFEETLKRHHQLDDGHEDHYAGKPSLDELDINEHKHGVEGVADAPAELIRKQWISISDEFTRNFQRILLRDFGIKMDDAVWGFQNFDLKDQNFQDQLTKAVIARSEARAERVRLDLTRDTAVVRKKNAEIEAEREKFERMLKADTERDVALMKVRTEQEVADATVEAEHHRKQKEREIEMEDARSKADAELYTVQKRADASMYESKKKADAEAYAINQRAEAEHEMMVMNPEHFRLRHAEIQANALANLKPQVMLGNMGEMTMMQALGGIVGKLTSGSAIESE